MIRIWAILLIGADEMVVHKESIYEVKKDNKGYVLINTIGKYENHGHLKNLKACKKIIKLMIKNLVPYNNYWRGTVLRVSIDKSYLEKVRHKIEKDKQKEMYININKGVKK